MSVFFKVYVLLHVFYLNGLVHTAGPSEPYDVPSAEEIFDLKCTYLYSALAHMKITKVELTCGNLDLNQVVYLIATYHDVVNPQITTFWKYAPDYVGALWLVMIYTSILYNHANDSNNRNDLIRPSDYNAILLAHTFIIYQLQAEITGCNQYNEFNKYNLNEHYLESLPISSLNEWLKDNKLRMLHYIENNSRFPVQSSPGFTRGVIFLKDYTVRNKDIKHFMNAYGVKVLWDIHMIENFKNMHKMANSFYWMCGSLKYVKDLFLANFNLFKIILFRLTWRHFFFLLQQDVNNVLHYASRWVDVLKQYIKSVGYENDQDVNNIKQSIESFMLNFYQSDVDRLQECCEEFYEVLVNRLKLILTDLCVPLNCLATESMQLSTNEIPMSERRPDNDPYDIGVMGYYSLFLARKLLVTISFRAHFDFGIVRSFIRYMDTLNTAPFGF